MVPTHPDYISSVGHVVEETVQSFVEKVPLIKMDWSNHLESWASK
jgi:hypothetical protein